MRDRTLPGRAEAHDRQLEERLVGTILAAARPELERRRRLHPADPIAARPGALALLAGWSLPTLTASAGIALAAAATFLVLRAPVPAPPPEAAMSEVLGIPSPIAEWLETGHPSALDPLLLAFEVDPE